MMITPVTLTSRSAMQKLAACGLAMLLLGACVAGRQSQVPVTDETRFIPIALWAGSDWDGRRDNPRPAVDTVTGRRANRTIRGPVQWTHPKTGERFWVYERINKKSSGTKRQLFAVNADATGLGRVFDSRPGQSKRYFDGDVIFPLGDWRQGEERRFNVVEYTDSGPLPRVAILKIRRLRFSYGSAPDSLEYDWTLEDTGGNVLFWENYIFSPGKSLVRFRDRLRS